MEQHPVPQNVTTFQFRLIGDMTIKQFGYLAGGAIVGYICYKLPLPFFFTWPLAVTSAVLGVGLAFVPIEERPMDVWLLSFIKSIYSPTQYLWQKSVPAQKLQPLPPAAPVAPQVAPTIPHITTATPHPSITQTLEHLFTVHPTPAPTQPPPPLAQHTPAFIISQSQPAGDPFGWFKQLFSSKPTQRIEDAVSHMEPLPSLTGTKMDPQEARPPLAQASVPLVSPQAQVQVDELQKKVNELQGQLSVKTESQTRIVELQKQLVDLLEERNKMEQELKGFRQKPPEPAFAPPVVQPAKTTTIPQPNQSTVRVITQDTAVKAGLPRLTTFPNVITGIIKDHDGNLLPGVLITVRDKDDIPVCALKTNKLGQFAASTPLPNNTYTVDIEDPRQLHFFDRIRVTLTGIVMSPVEVTSKSKKQMDRSQLEKAIFGGNKI